MNIYVCVKHVPDSAATITVEGRNGINEKITFLVNPYDEHALTEAVTLRKSMTDGDVVAVCLGKPAAENTLRSAMAMGADRSILIETDRSHDSIFTARALAAAIEREVTRRGRSRQLDDHPPLRHRHAANPRRLRRPRRPRTRTAAPATSHT